MEKTDILMFSFVNNSPLRNKWLDSFMFSITQLGEGWIVLFIMTAIHYGLGTADFWYGQSFVTVLAAGVVCQVVKKYFPRSRPVCILPNVNVIGKRLTSGSFPSGHTATSFALAVVFSYHWGDFTCLFFMMAVLIGVTRIYVGAHFPFDVFWGGLIGFSISNAIMVFLLIAHDYGVQQPYAAVLGGIVCIALILPLFGGYTFGKMYGKLKGKALKVNMLLLQRR
jgi:undecaprenyl-diphosphatase